MSTFKVIVSGFRSAIGRRLWVADYSMAEARDQHLANGRRVRAGCCSFALALLTAASRLGW